MLRFIAPATQKHYCELKSFPIDELTTCCYQSLVGSHPAKIQGTTGRFQFDNPTYEQEPVGEEATNISTRNFSEETIKPNPIPTVA